jgi:2-dehydro-3-deoxyphosphogluconate aldolase / (4S)-4-hydroxy-2-oxoglutarate aldolase
MKRDEVIRKIKEIGVVPVVRANSADEAMAAVEAIKLGGVPILEITMTVPGAIKVIEKLADRFGDEIVLGAGTVIDPETARACILAGATFVVSPATNVATIELCRRYSVPICPGALTPTEVVTAWQAGADFVKVFPCSAMGGASYIKGLKAPLPQVELIPTGGVNLNTAIDFIKAGSSALGVGADLVDLKALRAGDAAKITANASKFVQLVKEARS